MTSPASVFVMLFTATLLINSGFRAFSLDRSQLLKSKSFWQTFVAFAVGVFVSLSFGNGILQALGIPGIPHWADVIFTGLVVASGSENLSSLHDLGDGGTGTQSAAVSSLGQITTMNVTGTLTVIE